MKSARASFISFDTPEQEVEGRLHRHSLIESNRKGTLEKFTLLTEAGELVSFLGTVQIIEALATVEMGKYVIITYLGEVTTPGGKMKDFNIQIEA
jgi:hypothetical protein